MIRTSGRAPGVHAARIRTALETPGPAPLHRSPRSAMPVDHATGRPVLPEPPRARDVVTAVGIDDQTAAFEPVRPIQPPAGAPHVVIVLMDDLGFGTSSAFGGPVAMPAADRLADDGL